ncbi:uncharacterized protein ACR2FA_002390 [Aphomia sociella]
MKFPLLVIWFMSINVVSVWPRKAFVMDESWVCNVKKSCIECLRLPQCSWCPTDNKCFSMKIPNFKDYCVNNALEHKDYGFSLEDNAVCACSNSSGIELEQNCHLPGTTDGAECSGRGQCVCGRCLCDPTPDLEHPTKMVLGEYCEYDNFSCDGPKCNEGPYSIVEPGIVEEDNPKTDIEVDDATIMNKK